MKPHPAVLLALAPRRCAVLLLLLLAGAAGQSSGGGVSAAGGAWSFGSEARVSCTDHCLSIGMRCVEEDFQNAYPDVSTADRAKWLIIG